MTFNWIDVLLILLVLLSAGAGWRGGFMRGSFNLTRWIASWLAGLFLYRTVAGWLDNVTDWTTVWNQPFAFILVAVAAGLIIQFAGGALLRQVPKRVSEGRGNRIFGVLPGAATGLITAAIVSALLLSIPFSDGLNKSAGESRLANRLAAYAEELETAIVPVFEPAIRQSLERLTPVQPGSTDRAELPFKVDNAPARPELEAQMLELINRERAANGLAPLAADPELTEVARRHSADMFGRGYFSHNTPEGIDPFDRIRAANVRFRTAGENLAYAPTLSDAHTGLMNSPGHRANILKPQFGRVGIGILDGGRRGLMITQNFRN